MAAALRAKRASKAVTHDENAVPGVSNAAAPGGTKTALNNVLRDTNVNVNKTNGTAPTTGKAPLGPRRVLGDLSNAVKTRSTQSTTKGNTGQAAIVKRPHSSRTNSSSPNAVRQSVHCPTSQFSRPPSVSTANKPSRSSRVPNLRSSSQPTLETTEDKSNRPSTHHRSFSEAISAPGAPRIGARDYQDAINVPEVPAVRHRLVGLGLDIEGRDVTEASTNMEGLSMDEDEIGINDAGSETDNQADFRDDTSLDPEEDEDDDEDEESYDWTRLDPAIERDSQKCLQKVSVEFQEELDLWDTTMVAEYSEGIFDYMGNLEVKTMPDPDYMSRQGEIDWEMRSTLIDWLLQVHARYHMLPETLWIAINVIDRFLSRRPVGKAKLQLVGVTAMFIAAKYEEIIAPSVEEFVYMTQHGYTREEIIKGEQIVLTSLEFDISQYCTPYSWVRRISKADDYDIQTRTLSKFLMELTLLDYRFLRAKPSMIAAIGMYVARKMLGGEWNDAFMFYSGFTAAQLETPASFLIQQLASADLESKFVYKKYASKRFLKASIFACNYARTHESSSPVSSQ